MRRTEALEGIFKILQDWDGCMPEPREADQILTFLEKKAKLQGFWLEEVWEDRNGTPTKFLIPHPGWEPEKKKRKKRK